MSDHAVFSKAAHPFLFLNCGQGKYYHRREYDMRWINFDKLAHVTRYVGDIIERIDQAPADADVAPCDPFETEIRMLRKALGSALPLAMAYLGIKMPTDRKGLDETVGAILDGKLPV